MNNSEIILFIGPMFSGKTTNMIQRCKSAAENNHKVLVIKYKGDNRYNDESIIYTHDLKQISSQQNIRVVSVNNLSEVTIIDEDVIGIDEGQFFPDLTLLCEFWVKNKCRVIVAALDGDWKRNIFDQTANLIPLCNQVIKLQAKCMDCKINSAPFSWMFNQKDCEISDQKVIGGAERYCALCRDCYYKVLKKDI